ncbi:MAG: hypothetical protein PHT77_00680 [Bacteroidales bacterium]|nr:hypothetical protein [Bacteroidales bacterium]
MNRYLFIFCIFAFGSLSSFAQDVLLRESPSEAFTMHRKGRNRAAFTYWYAGYQVMPVATESIKPFASGDFFVGRRAKFARTRNFAMGYSMEYQRTYYINNHLLPEAAGIERSISKLVLNQLLIAYYNRVTFNPVGNNIGKFFDMELYGGWIFNNREIQRIDYEGTSARRIKTIDRNLPYIDAFCLGARMRIGIHRIALTANYRFTGLFMNTSHPEHHRYNPLPPLSIGLELGLYKPKL